MVGRLAGTVTHDEDLLAGAKLDRGSRAGRGRYGGREGRAHDNGEDRGQKGQRP